MREENRVANCPRNSREQNLSHQKKNSDQTGNIDGVPLCLAAVFICSTTAEHQNLIKAKKVGAGERIPLRQYYGGEGFCEPISSEGIDQGAAGSGSEEL